MVWPIISSVRALGYNYLIYTLHHISTVVYQAFIGKPAHCPLKHVFEKIHPLLMKPRRNQHTEPRALQVEKTMDRKNSNVQSPDTQRMPSFTVWTKLLCFWRLLLPSIHKEYFHGFMDYSESSNIPHERTPDPQLACLWRKSFHISGYLGYIWGVCWNFLRWMS